MLSYLVAGEVVLGDTCVWLSHPEGILSLGQRRHLLYDLIVSSGNQFVNDWVMEHE